jgi:hypothetical protein
MARLTPRYAPEEKARLIACMKPVERWTKYESQLWARSQFGFRHFSAPFSVKYRANLRETQP